MSRYDPRGKTNRALLVGVSEYDYVTAETSDGVPGQLPAVHHNRNRLKNALHHTGVFGQGEIVVCPSPYHDVFDEALHHAAQETDGLLLFYFAGHGIVSNSGAELFLQMRNARVSAGLHDVFPNSARLLQVLVELAGSRAERVVVVLDCCYAGNAAGIWQNFKGPHREKILLLMSVQSNRLIDGGDGSGATPFTEELVQLLDDDGELWLSDLYAELKNRMGRAGHVTAFGDAQEPQAAWEPGEDVLLRRGFGQPYTRPPTPQPPPRPSPWIRVLGALRTRLRNGTAWVRRHLRAVLVLLLALALTALGGYGIATLAAGHGSCTPPLELRVMTDPDLESTVRSAAATYLTSDANTTGAGCRRTGITVYSAGAADAVTALRERTDAWQDPGEDDDPQRDVGPQPDVWIPAAHADVGRVTIGQEGRVRAQVEPDQAPFAYSPVVLAVPNGLAGGGDAQRTGRSLVELIDDLEKRDSKADVRRTDPEYTDGALLATMGLYGGSADARGGEQRLTQSGPPAPTAADLLCTLPDNEPVDNSTAALVPEFLMKSGVGCDQTTRTRRTAEYPDDVPGLEPTFVRVRWQDGDRDKDARQNAVDGFHDWLTGEGGRTVLAADGFRGVSGEHPLLATKPAHGVLRAPDRLAEPAEGTAMDRVLDKYRSANGPGRVLFLLDSSGSMQGRWDGPSGGPGLLKQSLGGLGPQDEYGVWAVYGTTGSGHTDLLPFGPHKNGEAQRVLADRNRTRVRDAEADPHIALLAALKDMAGRGKDDDHPQLIVYLTDDEDDNRLKGEQLTQVLDKAHQAGVPVAMVSLTSGGCDRGRADALISETSGGRCLDAGDDLGAGLHDEVARTGTGKQ
ncbi:caspase family protein [Streptomyces sp. NPDC001982]|uniref:caspase family protein n=1 Tax=Streptomyces sp. NPDC001982 TaxID=3154405 RepID=UPI00332344E8